MVSSTLKLGISILNGGNAEVQQVNRRRDLGEGLGDGAGWEFGSCVTPRIHLHLLQKMLDYLKDKKEVGFFQSIQALMQTCRWVTAHVPLCGGHFRFRVCALGT